MPMITVPRAVVTTDEVSEALKQGLGSKYDVLPGSRDELEPGRQTEATSPRHHHGRDSRHRPFRAEVKLSRQPGQTVLQSSQEGSDRSRD
jgi:hypothetical protein